MKESNLLKLLLLFSNSNVEEKDVYNKCLTYLDHDIVFKQYSQGSECIREGAKADSFQLLLKGKGNIIRYGYDGRRAVLPLTDKIFGLYEVLAGEKFYRSSITCWEDCEVIKISVDRLFREIEENVEFCKVLLAYVSKIALDRMEDAERPATLDDYYIFLNFLKRQKYVTPSYPIVLEYSQKDIADILGISLRTICRYVRKLKDEGLISVRSRHITVTKEQIAHIEKTLDEVQLL